MFDFYMDGNDWLDDMYSTILGCNATVTQFRYRAAFVKHGLAELNRYDENVRNFEDFLARTANTGKDNHTTYKIVFPDGDTFAITCHDDCMIIGVGVEDKKSNN